MKLDRLVRIISVIEKIRKEPGLKYKDIAEDLEVSERTIRRDIDILGEAGLPIQNYNGLRFMSDVELPKVKFDPDEVMFLLLITNFLSRYEIDEEIPDNIYEKLKDYLPEKMIDKYKKLQKNLLIHPHNNTNDGREHIKRLKDIIESKNRVNMYYGSHSSKDLNWRMVDPYGVFFKKKAWYMVGYCHNNNEIRMFKCSRIKQLKTLPDKYEIPKGFELEEFLTDSFDLMRGEPATIAVKFTEEVAPLIEETTFNPKEKKTKKDGEIIYQITAANWRDVYSWVLSFGRKAEILEPKWLREKMLEEINDMKALYGQKIRQR
ncbi:helix-turn-helix transcriptional regulator [Natranaerofaba carboxydovora]|uniref:helix-turn-helix transcriptional regulator n=1 Tax=Natranaerofaba carboxydovora TaxID=2742683 RepID=UPI001F13C308|nr:WYL domain-containing transcriptional regulator [Natranaerofaba carboxydovora]UMZ73737.1 WYL domain protein [Natranaerofaba carboxydovora]